MALKFYLRVNHWCTKKDPPLDRMHWRCSSTLQLHPENIWVCSLRYMDLYLEQLKHTNSDDELGTQKSSFWGNQNTMYDFHNSTDTLKFWTKNELLLKLFCFSSDFDGTWWNCSTTTSSFLKIRWKTKKERFISSPFLFS